MNKDKKFAELWSMATAHNEIAEQGIEVAFVFERGLQDYTTEELVEYVVSRYIEDEDESEDEIFKTVNTISITRSNGGYFVSFGKLKHFDEDLKKALYGLIREGCKLEKF